MSFERELQVAKEAVKKAENIILSYYGNAPVERKADETPVTVADREAEACIKEHLSAHFPDYGFLGEESGAEGVDKEYVWVVDPIDGTKNFIREIPLWGTLVALLKKGAPVLGLSSVPGLQEKVEAYAGGGVRCNGQEVQTSEVQQLNEAMVVTGGLNHFAARGWGNAVLDMVSASSRSRAFGDLYSYHLLATGRADAVLEAKVSFWDIAAAAIIVEEAGGMVTDLNGKELTPQSTHILAAATPQLHKEILDLFL